MDLDSANYSSRYKEALIWSFNVLRTLMTFVGVERDH
jgi:hypothetical protein